MKTFFTICLFLICSNLKAQFTSEDEYSFTSSAYYLGKPEHLSDEAVIISYSEIHMVGSSGDYKAIRKFTEHETITYGFVSTSTDENGKGIWVCSDAEYNKGLLKVIYDPKSMVIEFKFKDGVSQIFFKVKRVK